MRNLIYQYFEDHSGGDSVSVDFPYHKMSRKSVSLYAERISSEYEFICSGAPFTPFYGIFLPFLNGVCDKYDNICFVDSDVLATNKSENVFKEASQDFISYNLMNDGYLTCQPINSGDPWKELGHGNSGVVVFPKSQFENLKSFIGDLKEHWNKRRKEYGDYDQLIINLFAKEYGYSRLNQKFNYHLGRYDFSKRFDMSLIHYHRKMKIRMKEDYYRSEIIK